MFSSFTVGILAGLGIGAWVYTKVMRSTGNRTRDALIVAASTCVGVVVLVMLLMSFIPE